MIIKQQMETIRRRSNVIKPECYIDIVSPQGEVIPTVDWVAKELVKQGWTEKPEEVAEVEVDEQQKRGDE